MSLSKLALTLVPGILLLAALGLPFLDSLGGLPGLGCERVETCHLLRADGAGVGVSC
jgi:hypothetical protein